ncbi:disintegrin and metalloproteinase domain-containing protein 12 isoform X2 [Scyliorhinus torazame]|uniref:disintegrin and metalloproteinase domain-containing protein 12 isoform X2 n=1 Tax=Scyliorhinus torazame TaxID=75743 RepID=UPI003B5A0F59
MSPSRVSRIPGSVPWLLVWAAVSAAWPHATWRDAAPGAGDRERPATGGARRTDLNESPDIQRGRMSPYEEVVPSITVDGEELRLGQVLQGGPAKSVWCTIRFDGRRLVLKLEQNENLLSGAHQLMYYLPNGTLVTETDSSPINCYYHGAVQGFPESHVSVSLCSGLRGLITLTRNQSYGIEPLVGDEDQVHLIHRREPVHFNVKRCAVSPNTQEHVAHQQDNATLHRSKRDILVERKYVELVMVADNKEFRNSGNNLKSLQMRLLEIANQVDAFYRPLNIRVALVGVEVWSKKDPFQIVKSPGDTLKSFLKWREEDLLSRLPHDNAQLLIGGSFNGSTVGMASQSSMCSRDRSGGVNVDHSVSVLGVASTIAHELGHNLGISHDTDDRKCTCLNAKRLGGCIMEPSTGFLPGQAFSSCSRDDLERSLKHGGAMCLFNFPASERLFGGQRCGNLYVEQDEECDCGLSDECDDPCCNATTCKLVPGAECSSEGACCANCKLKHAASVCRPPLGDCDLPEYCTGNSPYCPPNVFLKNGHTCDNDRAYCFNGACLTFELQCQVLWGPGSVQAHDICFNTVNKNGDKYGNCGQRPNGKFVSCAEEDAKCGKIQCQGGNDRPVLGSNAEILVTNIKVGREEYSCRGTFFNFGDDIADPAMVMPGTVCGDNKACINRTCQDISTFGVQECLQKCHSHGICNSNENCHCDPGWAPPFCQSSGYGGSVDSGPVQEPQGSGALLAALLVVFLFVLIATFSACYVKRDLVRSELRKLGKRSPPLHRDSRMENGHRAPSAGQLRYKPPERPQQTELRPAQAVKPAPPSPLRPAPPSKPLPPDPLIRVSQPLPQGPPGRPRPPSAPLPVDPTPKSSQPPLPRKPPPPKKPLPSDPGTRPTSAARAVTAPEHPRVSFYAEQDPRPPSRPAPPPPGKRPSLPPLPFAKA